MSNNRENICDNKCFNKIKKMNIRNSINSVRFYKFVNSQRGERIVPFFTNLEKSILSWHSKKNNKKVYFLVYSSYIFNV